jgi:hypothetical protein
MRPFKDTTNGTRAEGQPKQKFGFEDKFTLFAQTGPKYQAFTGL